MRRRTNPVTRSILPRPPPIDSRTNSQGLSVLGPCLLVRKWMMMKSELLMAIAEKYFLGTLYPTPYRGDDFKELVELDLVELVYDGPRYLGATLTDAGEQAALGGGHL